MGPKHSRSPHFTLKNSRKKKTKRPSRRAASKSRPHQVSLDPASSPMLSDAADHVIRDIRVNLNRAVSTAIVVQHALREQNVELDDDAADVLQHYVSDVLYSDVLRINQLLGEEEENGDDESYMGGVI